MGSKKTLNDNCVCKNPLETTFFYRPKNNFGPDNNTYLAQIITPKMPKLGPDNNFTAYIYIYRERERAREKGNKERERHMREREREREEGARGEREREREIESDRERSEK